MIELLLAVALAVGALWLVLKPILRPVPSLDAAESGTGDEGEDPDDDFTPRAVALRALKEIEFDRATDKLAESDYELLKTRYTAEAIAAARRDEGPGTREGVLATADATHPPTPLTRPVCPAHGIRSESDALFCSECGRRLGEAVAYCARCGSVVRADAQYCNTCGARVAARPIAV
jgi:hypothetical protein